MGSHNTLHFLIVDDEPEIREILALQLRELGFTIDGVDYDVEIHHASNGKEGLQKIASAWFDVVLTDINMPEMSGLEMLAAIRGGSNDVPVVMLTGFGDKAKTVAALRLGSYAFLDKPWKADYLRRVMQGAAQHGLALRSIAMKVEDKVAKFTDVPDVRRRQLRNVFRSMLFGSDGSHRTDVSDVRSSPTPQNTNKKAA